MRVVVAVGLAILIGLGGVLALPGPDSRSESDSQVAKEGLLGPAWSTTAPPSPTSSPKIAPRPSRSVPRMSPSSVGKPKAGPKPTTSPTRALPNPPRAAPLVRVGSWWVEKMRDCIARRESGRNPKAVDPTGTYFGMYQFDRRSWRIASGLSGVASQYSAAVQTRAFYVWFDNGKGLKRWTTSTYCLRLYPR